MRTLRYLALLALVLIIAGCGAAPQTAATPIVQPTTAAEAPAATSAATTEATPEATAAATTEATTEPTTAATEPVMGGTVTRAITAEPTSLDPHAAPGSGQNIILPYIFDTLIFRDMDNTYKPYLAKSWEISEDGLTVTFTLRDDVTFHDGTPLNADAVVFTFNRFKDAKTSSGEGLAMMTGVEAVDAYTVRFTFSAPSAVFFSTLVTPYAGIVSPTAVEAEGDAFGQQPVGSGPFKIAEWQQGTAVVLERNPDYKWSPETISNPGAPYIDNVVFKVIPDAATQLAALQAGEVDLIFVNSPNHISKLTEDSTVQLIETQLNSMVYLGFNCAKAPFDDVKVRQALSHAINKDEILLAALNGMGQVAFAPMAPTLPGFDASLKDLELGYDPAKATELLTEAGFAPGPDGTMTKDDQALNLVLLTFARAPNEDVATLIQNQLKAIGVNVEIQQFDTATAAKAATEGQFHLILWRYDRNDADVLNVNLHSDRIGSSNRFGYSNPEVDALLDQAAQELDETKRAALYVEAQKLIMPDAPWQPLYIPVDVLAISKRVEGFHLASMGRILLNEAQVVAP
ncbi:extracellular solute-binding protein, family 5 [Oscillochloris trichoides DG-6]|uniref:Extracellular solute-binding protein, family 5 n=1 Tax=Oscillochloris trichoides DG-6 TaxID=765420 RepID=E1IES1_9CHLR|nr:ABC transporter substrate-binding protein [Oscillochloris trichoides]EFO80320.1 extracellular solute-binding protein, family 5 [Oscillochloris trichoides DG-6]